jgi:hypothetical protein
MDILDELFPEEEERDEEPDEVDESQEEVLRTRLGNKFDLVLLTDEKVTVKITSCLRSTKDFVKVQNNVNTLSNLLQNGVVTVYDGTVAVFQATIINGSTKTRDLAADRRKEHEKDQDFRRKKTFSYGRNPSDMSSWILKGPISQEKKVAVKKPYVSKKKVKTPTSVLVRNGITVSVKYRRKRV